MAYVLGVDFGTTYTAAATCDDRNEPVMVALGADGYSVPSVLFVRDDNTFLVGDAAELRAASDPTRVTRHFKQRLGATTPIRLAGRPFAADDLLSQLLWWTQNQVWERRGQPPLAVVLTHPANWGPHRQSVLRDAAMKGGLVAPILIPEPAAAAIHYVRSERVELDELIAVYDLGGGTFDAVVMRRTQSGFEAVGVPAGIESLGGLTFDEAIRSFVMEAAGIDDLDETDEDAIAAAYALRANCIAAKRVLSADTVADVRVVFPSVTTTIRITRTEFEEAIRSHLLQTVVALEAAIASAGVVPADLSRILLVGGSSRIPLVKYLLEQRFGQPVSLDVEPKNSVALGAALYGSMRSGRQTDRERPPTPAGPTSPSGPTYQPPTTPARSAWPAPTQRSDPDGADEGWRLAPPPPLEPIGSPARTDGPEAPGELDHVQAESQHRARLPQAPPIVPIDGGAATTGGTEDVEEVPGVRPAVLIGAVVLVLLAVVAVILLAG